MNTTEIHDLAWSRLPYEKQVKAVTALKLHLGVSGVLEVQSLITLAAARHEESWLPGYFHFAGGMSIRNFLRKEVCLDKDLPPIPEWYGPDCSEGNWDDYYVPCLEAAAGMRACVIQHQVGTPIFLPTAETGRTGIFRRRSWMPKVKFK